MARVEHRIVVWADDVGYGCSVCNRTGSDAVSLRQLHVVQLVVLRRQERRLLVSLHLRCLRLLVGGCCPCSAFNVSALRPVGRLARLVLLSCRAVLLKSERSEGKGRGVRARVSCEGVKGGWTWRGGQHTATVGARYRARVRWCCCCEPASRRCLSREATTACPCGNVCTLTPWPLSTERATYFQLGSLSFALSPSTPGR